MFMASILVSLGVCAAVVFAISQYGYEEPGMRYSLEKGTRNPNCCADYIGRGDVAPAIEWPHNMVIAHYNTGKAVQHVLRDGWPKSPPIVRVGACHPPSKRMSLLYTTEPYEFCVAPQHVCSQPSMCAFMHLGSVFAVCMMHTMVWMLMYVLLIRTGYPFVDVVANMYLALGAGALVGYILLI